MGNGQGVFGGSATPHPNEVQQRFQPLGSILTPMPFDLDRLNSAQCPVKGRSMFTGVIKAPTEGAAAAALPFFS